MADRKSRQMLHKAKKQNPDSVVVATGCYVQIKEKEVLEDLAIDIVLGNNKKHELIELLKKMEKEHTCSISSISPLPVIHSTTIYCLCIMWQAPFKALELQNK